eukprot:m.69563 g.69563  ORF g.69563 m.69563 type:complete len:125 (+) comp35619_c0_seq7:1915-2289(+)
MAEHVEDALLFVKTTFQSYLTSRHKELAGRLAGQAVFDILGLVDAQRHFDLLLELSSSLIDAIAEVPPSASTKDATLCLSSCLKSYASKESSMSKLTTNVRSKWVAAGPAGILAFCMNLHEGHQ